MEDIAWREWRKENPNHPPPADAAGGSSILNKDESFLKDIAVRELRRYQDWEYGCRVRSREGQFGMWEDLPRKKPQPPRPIQSRKDRIKFENENKLIFKRKPPPSDAPEDTEPDSAAGPPPLHPAWLVGVEG